MLKKKCKTCGELKPLSEYNKRGRAKDGLQYNCKSCRRIARVSNKGRAYRQNYRSKYPERDKANRAIERAVKNGDIKKEACQVCNEVKVEAHHEDYSKLLDVDWLCHTHHRQRDEQKVSV